MKSILILALIAVIQVPIASAACRTPSARSCDSKRVGALPLDLAKKLRDAVSKKNFAPKNLALKGVLPFVDKLLADIVAASGMQNPELITIDVLPMTGYFVVTTASPQDADLVGEHLKGRDIVTLRDVTFGLSQSTSTVTPPKPQWNMSIIGESTVPAVTVRSRPIIAVIDTAIETHPDLANRFWNLSQDVAFPTARPTFKCGAGTYGYNAVTKQCITALARAGKEHGTHVSGIIGGNRNSTNGAFGVDPFASILPIEAFTLQNGAYSACATDIADGLEYVMAAKRNGEPIAVVNASWGSQKESPALKSTLEQVAKEHIVVVAGAGNCTSDNDKTPFFPANWSSSNDHIVSVSGSNTKDNLAGGSNRGATTVQIAAPGANVLSTFPNADYGKMIGTSMAAAHVSGAVALVMAACSKSPEEALNIVIECADQPSTLTGLVKNGRRLNVANALKSCSPCKQR